MAPKWLLVARNEYRIHTSRIRRIRPYLPYLVVGLLTVYVAFIAPRLVGLFFDDFLALLLSQAAAATVQVTLFMIFILFMTVPVTSTLREERTGQLEIFLAAPVRPSDVLLGEFLGAMPFYAIFATLVFGLFTAALTPLGLSVAQTAITIVIFLITFSSGLWIGTVISALLRTKLAETARGRDIGRALAMILALPLLALVYAIQLGGLPGALADPTRGGAIRAILDLLPSSWGAEVIAGFASNPGNISAVGFETLTRFGGLLAFFVVALWLGGKAADRAYSLEAYTFTASRAKPDGRFYKTVKYLGGGGSFGTLLVSIFKDYSRRLENLSMITYMLGALVLMNIFVPSMYPAGPDAPPVALMMSQVILPIVVVMATGGVTVHRKENLFIYRKTPSGEGKLVKAMLLQGWLVVVPIAGAVSALSAIRSPQITFASLLATTGLAMLVVAATMAFSLGVFLVNPVFSEKSVKMWLNVLIVEFGSIGLLVASSPVLMIGGGPIGGMLGVQLVHAALSWLVGIILLYLGKKKLSRLE